MFIEMRRKARFVASAAMHAGIPGGKVIDSLLHADKRGRAGRAVKVDVAQQTTVEEGYHGVCTNDTRSGIG